MSISRGNFYTRNDISERNISRLVFRYLVLTSHYHSPLNFTWDALKAATVSFERLRGRVAVLAQTSENMRENKKFRTEFKKHLADDLNMPNALAVLWTYFDALSSDDFLWADRILGLRLDDTAKAKIPDEIRALADERERARDSKEWKKADELRDAIQKLGWTVGDTPNGPILKPLNLD